MPEALHAVMAEALRSFEKDPPRETPPSDHSWCSYEADCTVPSDKAACPR